MVVRKFSADTDKWFGGLDLTRMVNHVENAATKLPSLGTVSKPQWTDDAGPLGILGMVFGIVFTALCHTQ